MLRENFFYNFGSRTSPTDERTMDLLSSCILKWLEKSVKRICKKLSEEIGHPLFELLHEINYLLFIILTAVHNLCIIRKLAT